MIVQKKKMVLGQNSVEFLIFEAIYLVLWIQKIQYKIQIFSSILWREKQKKQWIHVRKDQFSLKLVKNSFHYRMSNKSYYHNTSKAWTIFPCESFEKMIEKLAQHNIRKKKNFNETFEKIIVSKAGNVYTFTISDGYFETEIYFLELKIDKSCLKRQPYSFGAQASIFMQQYQNEFYIIKSQEIPQQSLSNFDCKFDKILQEYLVNKIASILEFGPKIKTLYGFDIVCFNNCLEFSMELCEVKQLWRKESLQKYEEDLLYGMKIMHSLRIVHRDIKRRNVSWSPSYQKWVFLDFGFASSIKQRPGKRTFTYFRGTYEYASKQMKTLYHFKKAGFVDLYANDLHGLKISKKDKFSYEVKSFSQKSSPQFQVFINLIRMQNYIEQKQFALIESHFQQHIELKNEFLGLLLIQVQRYKFIWKGWQQYFFSLYEKLKNYQSNESQTNEDNEFLEQNQKLIKTKCEKQKYLKFFLTREQSNKSTFSYMQEKKLKKLILQKWGSFQFMKDLFMFFQETLYGSSKAAWEKMKIIIDIVSQLLFLKCQKKWLWKFPKILGYFEQKFLENKQYKHLEQISFCYYFFNDKEGCQILNKILLSNQIEYHDIFDFYCSLQKKIAHIVSKNQIQVLFRSAIKIIEKESSEGKKILLILQKIAELFVALMQMKKFSISQRYQFEQMFAIVTRFKITLKQPFHLFFASLFRWVNKFLVKNSQEEEPLLNNIPYSLSSNKYFILNDVLQQISLEGENPQILQSYFQHYPICKQLPTKAIISYYQRKGNTENLSQITQNIFQFNKNHIQQVIEELNIGLEGCKFQLVQKRKQILEMFLFSFEEKLVFNNQEIISKYWSRYARCSRSLNFFRDDDKIKSQVISSFSKISSHFRVEDLSPSNKIYMHLMHFFKNFYEGNPLTIDQLLKSLQKYSLLREFKENIGLLVDFLQAISFYQFTTGKLDFQKTSFYSEICSNEHQVLSDMIYENKKEKEKQFQGKNIIFNKDRISNNTEEKGKLDKKIFKRQQKPEV